MITGLILFTLLSCSQPEKEPVIIDSDISLETALEGTIAPKEITDRLALVTVTYYSSDQKLHQGQLVIDSLLIQDVEELFSLIRQERILIEMVIPIKFDRPDGNTSMNRLNNSYSFHYRRKTEKGATLSLHAYGRAIDLNPFDNPFLSAQGDTIPQGAHYDPSSAKALTKESPIVRKMVNLGWIWGGDWNSVKDYMHFEKQIPPRHSSF